MVGKWLMRNRDELGDGGISLNVLNLVSFLLNAIAQFFVYLIF